MDKPKRLASGVTRSSPYMILTAPDHSSSTIIRQATGKAVWRSEEPGHEEAARAQLAQLEAGEGDE